ncbi:MAG: hypothetical protein ACE5IR_20975 [bacterium]
MSEDERFKLYLTNTLEMEEIEQIAILRQQLEKRNHARRRKR